MAADGATHVPAGAGVPELAAAAAECRACELWERGTQTVFGEGPDHSRLVLVGEQPGDEEDLSGHPFVGPAGRILDKALEAAGIDRREVYVTNAVKHFRWEERGKRRIHKKPATEHVRACAPWLEAELSAVKPEVVVALGATAAQALLGRTFRLTQHRREFFESDGGHLVTATVHPSSILRAPDAAAREAQMQSFVDDLAAVAERLS